MSDEEWIWQFRKPAKQTYDDLDDHLVTARESRCIKMATVGLWVNSRSPDTYWSDAI